MSLLEIPHLDCQEIIIKPSRPNPGRREKNKLIFYFYNPLWCLKVFYEGLKGTTKKCENKNVT